jgi:hypothetical protein
MLGAVLTAAVLFAQAAPASAPTAAAARSAPADISGVTVTAKKHPDVDPKEVVCHSELPIGSRFPMKVCASHQDIAERRQIDQMEVRRWTALRPGSSN